MNPDEEKAMDDADDRSERDLQLRRLADAVGAAAVDVLGALTAPERLAYVLHELFAVPCDEIATILGRTPAGVRHLAARARDQLAGSP